MLCAVRERERVCVCVRASLWQDKPSQYRSDDPDNFFPLPLHTEKIFIKFHQFGERLGRENRSLEDFLGDADGGWW